MNRINKQIAHVRRLMTLQRGVESLPWLVLIASIVCFVALVIPKLIYLPYTYESWSKVWIAGCVAAAMVATIAIAWIRRPSPQEAAIELDKRFQLKERISSAVGLSESERVTPAGKALLHDAETRADRIDVRDRFALKWGQRFPWVVLPILGCVVLFWIPDANMSAASALNVISPERLQNVKANTAPILEQVQKVREQLEADGEFPEAEDLKRLEKRIEELQNPKNADPKEMLSDFNAIKKQLEDKRDSLRSSDELKKSLQKLGDAEKGTGDKFSEAMKRGETSNAMSELEKLERSLNSGEMTPEEMKNLAKQLRAMEQALNELQQEQNDALQKLQDELQQAMEAGDLSKAKELQDKIDDMQKQMASMGSQNSIAKSLEKAAKALEKGDKEAAEKALKELQEEMDRMEQEKLSNEQIDKILKDLEDAKKAANCKECTGGGCEECKGGGKESKQGSNSKKKGSSNSKSISKAKFSGRGPGIGSGSGNAPPEEQIDVEGNEDQVIGPVSQGDKVYGGKARGPNRPGMTLEEAKEAIKNATPEDLDGTESIAVPKAQRDQQREYFERIRNQ